MKTCPLSPPTAVSYTHLVGSTLYFEGRLQSRTYTKNLGDRTEERVAFEVSVMNLAAREALEPAAL